MRMHGKMAALLLKMQAHPNAKLLVSDVERKRDLIKIYPELKGRIILPPKQKKIKPIVYKDELTFFTKEQLYEVLSLFKKPRTEEKEK